MKGSCNYINGEDAAYREKEDIKAFLDCLAALKAKMPVAKLPSGNQLLGKLHDLFDFSRKDSIFIARSPGRLDVMGGISDYSGALVLEMPIHQACFCACQLNQQAGQGFRVITMNEIENKQIQNDFSCNLDDIFQDDKALSYKASNKFFNQNKTTSWVAYILGCLIVLFHEKKLVFDQIKSGVSILIKSDVPIGAGVSSSAATEVSSLMALSALFGVEYDDPMEIALLAQKVENYVAGAPCGIMDQATCLLGKQDQLLALECTPCTVIDYLDIPSNLSVYGIDSKIQHSVKDGNTYNLVRCAAFMGKTSLNRHLKHVDRQNYLCNFMTPSKLEMSLNHQAQLLPMTQNGAEFLRDFPEGNSDGPITVVNVKTNYPVRAAVRHAVYENFRTRSFSMILDDYSHKLEKSKALGELMFQSHESYSACGLGSIGTDQLVQLIRDRAEGGNLFGAKISGGGSGGTVVILASKSEQAMQHVLELKQQYELQHGIECHLFQGSSPGAIRFGVMRI